MLINALASLIEVMNSDPVFLRRSFNAKRISNDVTGGLDFMKSIDSNRGELRPAIDLAK